MRRSMPSLCSGVQKYGSITFLSSAVRSNGQLLHAPESRKLTSPALPDPLREKRSSSIITGRTELLRRPIELQRTFSPIEPACLRRSSLASSAQTALNTGESDTDVKQHSAPGVAGYRHIHRCRTIPSSERLKPTPSKKSAKANPFNYGERALRRLRRLVLASAAYC